MKKKKPVSPEIMSPPLEEEDEEELDEYEDSYGKQYDPLE